DGRGRRSSSPGVQKFFDTDEYGQEWICLASISTRHLPANHRERCHPGAIVGPSSMEPGIGLRLLRVATPIPGSARRRRGQPRNDELSWLNIIANQESR